MGRERGQRAPPGNAVYGTLTVRGATGRLARKVVGKVRLGQILEGPECPTDNSLDVFAERDMIQPVFENCLPSGSCRRNSFVSTDDLLPVIPANFTKST